MKTIKSFLTEAEVPPHVVSQIDKLNAVERDGTVWRDSKTKEPVMHIAVREYRHIAPMFREQRLTWHPEMYAKHPDLEGSGLDAHFHVGSPSNQHEVVARWYYNAKKRDFKDHFHQMDDGPRSHIVDRNGDIVISSHRNKVGLHIKPKFLEKYGMTAEKIKGLDYLSSHNMSSVAYHIAGLDWEV